MITCPNCLKKHENGTKVCDECGYDLLLTPSKHADPLKNGNNESEDIGAENDAANAEGTNDDAAGSECAPESKPSETYLDINDEDDDMPYDAYRYQKVKNPRKLRRFNKTAFLRITCISLAAIFVLTSAILLLSYLFGDKKYPKYVMYVRDGELTYYGVDDKKSVNLPVDVDTVVDLDSYFKLCRLSDDGDVLFFASDYQYGDSTVNLSFIDFSSKKPQITNIGYEAVAYSISNRANKVIYLKEEDGNTKLFSYSTSTSRRVLIAEGVNRFVASDDGASVVYYETDATLMKLKGSNRVKVADEAYIAWTADKCLYYYTFEETDDGFYQRLYYHDGETNIRVLDDWAEVVTYVDGFKGAIVAAYTEDGTDIYYVAGGKATKLKLSDPDFFIANHWISEDGKTLYYLDEPDESYYSDYYDPEAIFEGLLFKMTLKKDSCKAAEEIDEDVNGGEFLNGDVFVYRKKTSEETGAYALYRDGELIDKKVVGIVGADGKDVVYYKATEDYDTYQLFKDGKKIDSDVIGAVILDGDLIYFKTSSSDYDLVNVYKDKKVIAKNVWDISFYKDKKMAFLTEFNDELGNGKVNVYDGGKVRQISDDVYSYSFTLSGDVAYIADVDSTNCGDLYFYSNKKIQRIAKDVDADYIGIVDAIGVVSEDNFVDVLNDIYN